ncbi:GntR family transcriptional regulator [Streptomyces sioyaensis]|uniref:GntR family transcriptional regulator n=1 Tax=Streptomyces sioyaensis TaxID=67364 RepID=A0A4Q1QNT9_9ACTN|nr:GntR family transcriptional regulator [Streptomyces sioyaensis]MBM4794601.1 GntR family transcriptional regulator [Streptomyces sioyaensis]RXS62279.1 GntR family transcriptional regulator [Streptomyces sioyaensis]
MTPTADASRRVNEQIADALQKDIESGKLKAGEKLPAVRSIASDFGVAPGTATKALQLLVQRGFVRPDSTRGYFVSSRSETAEGGQPSPEFVAIMQEIESIRAHLARLDDRLNQLEDSQGSA